MNVTTFIKGTKGNAEKVSKHITKQYIPILEKDAYMTKIADAGMHTQNDGRTFFKKNTVTIYVAFIMRLIDMYTDIDVKWDDAEFVKEYDALAESGLLDIVLDSIPDREYKECKTILDMKVDDTIINEYSTPAVLYNLIESSSLFSEMLTSVIKEQIQQ